MPRIARLGEIAEIQLGKMLSPKSKTGHESFPYLRNQNVQWNRFDLADVAYMDFSERERQKFRLRKGGVLVCEGGEPGRTAVWQGQIDECYYQKALHRIRPSADLDAQYLAFWMWHLSRQNAFTDSNAKTTISHLPLVRLTQVEIPLPKITEQRYIAQRLIEQLAAVEEARRACELQIDSIALFSESCILESYDFGNLRSVRLGDAMTEVSKGVGQSWAQYPVLGATRDGLALAKEPVGKVPQRYKLVDQGAVFYNPMRIMIGSIAMVDDGQTPGITSPDYVVIKGKPAQVNTRWFYYWLRSRRGVEFIRTFARGAVRERLMFKRLAEATLEMPDVESQNRVAEKLRHVPEIKAKIATRLNEINAISANLLRHAFAEPI